MFKVYKKEIEVAGKKISLETGKVARQADGAIIATCGETVVLATVVGAKKVNPDVDYFPLSVNSLSSFFLISVRSFFSISQSGFLQSFARSSIILIIGTKFS